MAAIQIKNVPDDIRGTLVEAAKSNGQSLQSYLLDTSAEQAHFARNAGILRRLPVESTDVTMDDVVTTVRESRGPLPDEADVQ